MLLIILLLVVIAPINIRGQHLLSNAGAKNESLGNLSSISSDEWSLWRNPAGLTSVDGLSISSSIRKPLAIPTSTRSLMLSSSTKIGSFATGVSTFGDDLYNESMASLGFANQLGLASLGIRADVYQLRIDSEATRRAFGVTVGCVARISRQLSIGISARNINLPAWARGQPLPVVLTSGLSFKPGDSFMIVAEVEKDTDYDPTFKGGFEYSVRKKIFFRTGFNLFPNAAFGGIGLRMWRLGLDYALKFGSLPGYSQQLSLTMHLRK